MSLLVFSVYSERQVRRRKLKLQPGRLSEKIFDVGVIDLGKGGRLPARLPTLANDARGDAFAVIVAPDELGRETIFKTQGIRQFEVPSPAQLSG